MRHGEKISASCLTLLGVLIVAAVVSAAMLFATHRLNIDGIYWLVPIFGALGGTVGGIIRSDNKLELSFFENGSRINLGCLGDTIVGLGGASAVVFLFGGTLLRFNPKEAESLVLIVSISFVAGAYGRKIVEVAGEKLLRKAREEARQVAKEEAKILVGHPAAVAYTYAARDAINAGETAEALQIVSMALQNDPNHAGAWIEEGRALRRLGRVKEALVSLEKALKANPEKAEAFYNRACYNLLLGKSAADVAPDLEKAVTLLPKLIEFGPTDPDLKKVLNTPEIRKIFYPQPIDGKGVKPQAEVTAPGMVNKVNEISEVGKNEP